MWKKLLAWLKKILEKKVATAPTTTPDTPPSSTEYVVKQNDRVEKTLKVPCKVSFDILVGRDGSPDTEDVPVWAYSDGGDFAGGNPSKGVMSVRVNCYNANALKVKFYDTNGYVDEPKISCNWLKGTTHKIELELKNDSITASCDGVSKTLVGNIPASVIVGHGWPPSKRQGCLDSKITNVVYTEAK